MKWFSGECHRTSLIRIQHWFRQWLDAVRQQAISWTNVNWDLCHCMVLVGHNELTLFHIVIQLVLITTKYHLLWGTCKSKRLIVLWLHKNTPYLIHLWISWRKLTVSWWNLNILPSKSNSLFHLLFEVFLMAAAPVWLVSRRRHLLSGSFYIFKVLVTSKEIRPHPWNKTYMEISLHTSVNRCFSYFWKSGFY